MADIELVIKIPEELYEIITNPEKLETMYHAGRVCEAVRNGTPLPKGHGRLGDLDELEHRISNFVEHDADITDGYTVERQRFIIDGIKETPTIIKADKESER